MTQTGASPLGLNVSGGVEFARATTTKEGPDMALVERAGRIGSKRMRTSALICALAGVLIGTGCGGSEPAPTPDAPGASTGGVPRTDAAPVRTIPQEPGPLAPGRYRLKLYNSDLSLTLGAGWESAGAHAPEFTSIFHADGSLIAFVRFTRVADPAGRPANEAAARRTSRTRPNSLIDWLQHHPRVQATGRRTVTLAGRRAERIDIKVIRGYRYRAVPPGA